MARRIESRYGQYGPANMPLQRSELPLKLETLRLGVRSASRLTASNRPRGPMERVMKTEDLTELYHKYKTRALSMSPAVQHYRGVNG